MLAPLFTLFQATVGGWFLPLLLPVIAIPVWRWPKETHRLKRIAWLIAMFLPWVLLAYWTQVRWHGPGEPTKVALADEIAATATLFITAFSAIAAVVVNKGARKIIAFAGLLNVYLSAVGALLCIMATSGNWI
jgi:hypothetical protein